MTTARASEVAGSCVEGNPPQTGRLHRAAVIEIEGEGRETRAGRGKHARVSRFSSGRGPPDESDRQFKPDHQSACAAHYCLEHLSDLAPLDSFPRLEERSAQAHCDQAERE